MADFTSEAGVLLVMQPGTDSHDVCGDYPTGQENHLFENERKSSPGESMNMVFQKSELGYRLADATTLNTVAVDGLLWVCTVLGLGALMCNLFHVGCATDRQARPPDRRWKRGRAHGLY